MNTRGLDRTLHFQRHPGCKQATAPNDRARAPRRASRLPGGAGRRVGDRQGIDRPRDPQCERVPPRSIRRRELRNANAEKWRFRSCAGMNRDRSPAPTDIPIKGFSPLRGKAPCSSTNFKICHPLLRVCCCGSWKPAVLSALEAPKKSIVGYGWWSRPTFQSRN
jgi:hypothetical protein